MRRLSAWLLAFALLLPALQGSASACMASKSVTAGSHDARDSHAGHAQETASDHQMPHQQSPDHRHHDGCPDREAPQPCSAMTACVAATALPIVAASSMSPAIDQSVDAAIVARPPTLARAPELPPPRA